MGNRTYPDAYVDYLVHFHASRDYFECHEILEEYWKEHPGDPLSGAWVGLIQIAVGLYHLRRGNRAGAVKMWRSALDRQLAGFDAGRLGLDDAALKRELRARLDELERLGRDEPLPAFRDLDLPIADETLLQACRARSKELGFSWISRSPLDDPELIHRHSRRDRSEVLLARERELRRRLSLRIEADLPYTICFIRRGDEVLLLNRRSAPWMGCWNGVGGKLEPGETPAANIVREIREETGLELKQSEVVWKGIVTWTVDGGRLGGMHVFVANLPGHLALETPKQTEEGILDWKRIDWITDPANQGVASNVPRFLTTLFEDASEWEHRCVFEAGRLTGYERLPLGVDLRTVRRGNG